jgi:hypothetical protein
VQNDALLHRLVHTKLLSGSLNPELNMTPAEQRKALAGRVLEVSGIEKLGKGERAVREQERNKAAKHIREGIAEKQKTRDKRMLDEVSDLFLKSFNYIDVDIRLLGQKYGKLSPNDQETVRIFLCVQFFRKKTGEGSEDGCGPIQWWYTYSNTRRNKRSSGQDTP